MTKTELLKRLRQLAKSDDTESAHAIADDSLIAFINDDKIRAAYHAITKWYA